MRLIPPYPNPKTQSDAELKIFRELEQINFPDMICFHSLNLPEHEYKIMGELDFVIVCPQGLIVLEVKGGGVECREGIWKTTDRWGKNHKLKESPFDQAKSGMWSLTKRLYDAGISPETSNLTPGYGVVFPDVTFNQVGEEWEVEVVLDQKRLGKPRGMEMYLKELLDHWHKKSPNKPEQVSATLTGKIIQYLRPDFELVPSIQVQAGEIEERLVRLTEEQYERLDVVEHEPRILIQGGAGTGKTLLAMEVARRHARQGEKVLLICFSPVLAEYLRQQNTTTGVEIRSVHGLMREHVKKDQEALRGYYPGMPITDLWFREKLAPAFETMTREMAETDKYDVLVVDEGQDILNLAYLSGVEHLLRGGYRRGKWRVFFDPYHQGAIYNAMDPDTLLMLKDYGAATPRLKINCRNTDPIINQTRLATGAEIAARGTGPGPDVVMRFYRDQEQQAEMLEEFLDELDRDDVPPGEITILSPEPYEKSGVSLLNGRLKSKIRAVNGNLTLIFPQDAITFATVAEFKGLENRYIALIDIEKLDSPGDLDTLYVGMTRPRVKLWLLVKDSLQDAWNRINLENLKKMSGSLPNE